MSDEKQFNCTLCGKDFSERSDMNKHVEAVHEKNKPYHCSICSTSLTIKGRESDGGCGNAGFEDLKKIQNTN